MGTPNVSAPMMNNSNKNLEKNVKNFVEIYLRNRNNMNTTKVNTIKQKLSNNVSKYVNVKRRRVSAPAAAAAANAGATVGTQTNVAEKLEELPPNTTPANAGKVASLAIMNAGGNPSQAAAGAAAAANSQALVLHQSPAAAQQAGAEAAAEAAVQHTNTPTAAAAAANNGAAAANLNANKAEKLAKIKALLNAVNVNKFNNIPIANLEKLKANLLAINLNNSSKTAVLGMINSRLATNVAQNVGKGSLSNAQISLNRINGMLRRNVPAKLSQGTANALRRKLNANVALARNAGLINAERNQKITNYRSRINAALSGN
jgi:hypothetical protein